MDKRRQPARWLSGTNRGGAKSENYSSVSGWAGRGRVDTRCLRFERSEAAAQHLPPLAREWSARRSLVAARSDQIDRPSGRDKDWRWRRDWFDHDSGRCFAKLLPAIAASTQPASSTRSPRALPGRTAPQIALSMRQFGDVSCVTWGAYYAAPAQQRNVFGSAI